MIIGEVWNIGVICTFGFLLITPIVIVGYEFIKSGGFDDNF